MAKVNFKIEGMKELQKSMKKLGKVPQKHVTASARKGMNIALKQSKANAPYETGNLKKGTIMVGEKAQNKGKKVYRIVFDRRMNDVFQHKTKSGGYRYVTNAKGKAVKRKTKVGDVTGYYPVSQEYGFFARNGRYIPGYRFISDSLTDNVSKIEKTIVSEMQKRVDDELRKMGWL